MTGGRLSYVIHEFRLFSESMNAIKVIKKQTLKFVIFVKLENYHFIGLMF